jgi:hypothetical protein
MERRALLGVNRGTFAILPSSLLNHPKNARCGHPAYRIPVEIIASVGPVSSPGDNFHRLGAIPDLQNWIHFAAMKQALGAPGTAAASCQTAAPTEPERRPAPVHGELLDARSLSLRSV